MKTSFWVLTLALLLTTSLLAESTSFQIDSQQTINMVNIKIPAPLETTKAQLDSINGTLSVDLDDLKKTSGSILVDLTSIQAQSFNDPDKNLKQTEHMINWFEIGSDVDEAIRKKNQFAKFEIKKIIALEKKGKEFIDEIGTGQQYTATASGSFTVHSVSKDKNVSLLLTLYKIDSEKTLEKFKASKQLLMIRTLEPFLVSLKEHDVKPRDLSGKFLSTALSIVGLKLSDTAYVQIDLRALSEKDKNLKN